MTATAPPAQRTDETLRAELVDTVRRFVAREVVPA